MKTAHYLPFILGALTPNNWEGFGSSWRNTNSYNTRHGTPSSGKLRSKKAKRQRVNIPKTFGKNKKKRRR